MARARNIKPGFFANEALAELDPFARLLFIGLWMLADRDGIVEDRPKRIRAEVFPYESVEIEKLLESLRTSRFISRYSRDGVGLIHITEFAKHQNPHKNEKDSEYSIPSREEQETSWNQCVAEHSSNYASTSDKIGTTRADLLNPDSGFSDSLIPDSGAQTVAPLPSPDKPAPPKKPRQAADEVSMSDMLRAGALTEDVAKQYLAHRRRKRALLTPAAWKAVVSEIQKSGRTLQDGLCYAMNRGWTGFESTWDGAGVSAKGSGSGIRNIASAVDFAGQPVAANGAGQEVCAPGGEVMEGLK